MVAAAAAHAWEELIAPAALRTSGDGDTDARMEAVCTKAFVLSALSSTVIALTVMWDHGCDPWCLFTALPPRTPLAVLCTLAAMAAVGPPGYCSPRHPTHFEPLTLELNGTL